MSRQARYERSTAQRKPRRSPGPPGTITVPAGQHVRPLPDGDRYLGFIFAEAGTPSKAAAALRTARSQLRVIIQ